MKKIIAVIGDRSLVKGSLEEKIAFQVGKALDEAGYRIQAGGMGGVMEEVYKGARSASTYQEGDTIAILPSFDKNDQDGLADIVIPTGLDIMRSGIVTDCDFVVAIGGGAGTLSEICAAWALYRPIVAFKNCGGWASKVAGIKLDEHTRYEGFDDRIFSCSSPEEMLKIIKEKMPLYVKYHSGIKMAKKNG
ncbi:MAG: acyl-CoA synthetase [Bacilli bacterium]|jgi:uncharacterized protein (TIGR00725 family)|nr:acyl-CoA synthetase [Bacilli bacterium]